MATSGKTYSHLLGNSHGIDGYRTEHLFAAECISRRIPCFLASCASMTVDAICQSSHGHLFTVDCKSSRFIPPQSPRTRADITNACPDADILAILDLVNNAWSIIPYPEVASSSTLSLGSPRYRRYLNRWDILAEHQW